MIRALIVVLFWAFGIPLAAILGFPWTIISRKIDFLYNTAMKIARAGVWLTGVKVEIVGLDRFDNQGTYIYMCNHVSNIDPPIVIPAIPKRTSVLVKLTDEWNRYFPSRDQSQGLTCKLEPRSATSSSEPEPSLLFR